ncbi:hypothetical protein VNO78_32818 [Psophocarpus tetragonolobus]|uniref:Uncharacterized protein n=1 Tax=Psophocarpus tetragonolobus TaxID=3891 RepID=A0AAN9NVU7_PSOTE
MFLCRCTVHILNTRTRNTIEAQTCLFRLDLSTNQLEGTIPTSLGNLCNLRDDLAISGGSLPPSMGSLAELNFLRTRNNSLSSTFPTILKKTNKLIFLDLGENKFSGTIPTWVGESLLNMKILLLRSNKFLGHIPKGMCHMSFLQVLDLAQNNLYTSMSVRSTIASVLLWLKGREDEYKNFLGLVTSIDLSNNKLLGAIPREITDLNGLNFLNLSHDQLIGHIPQAIGNMRSLQATYFSRNQLTGEIPPSISNLSFLSMLDLSYNHLEGKIPTGTQLQTFDASNFIGNNLCGPPLPVNCSSNGKIQNSDYKGKQSDRHGMNWFFVSMTCGFVVGFWIVIAPLLICRSWRYAYFNFLDHVLFKLQSFH